MICVVSTAFLEAAEALKSKRPPHLPVQRPFNFESSVSATPKQGGSYHGRRSPVTGGGEHFSRPACRRRSTMFEQQLAAAVTTAATFAQIDALSRAVWKAHAAGLIDDAAAQAAAEALEARKALVRGGHSRAPEGRAHGRPRRPPPRSPDREASIRRRRSCAASGAVPAAMACNFTLGEVAVLSAVAGQIRRSGDCRLPLDAIAALAGVCRRTAQYAIRRAAGLGYLHVQERPRPGQKHLPSVLTVADAAWRAWLRLGGDRVQKRAPHVKQVSFQTSSTACKLRQAGAAPSFSRVAAERGTTWTEPPLSPSKTPPKNSKSRNA